jgi:hypothetical protein
MVSVPGFKTKRLILKPLSLDDIPSYEMHFIDCPQSCHGRIQGRSRRIKEKTGARLIDVRPAKFVDPSYSAHEIWELKRSDWISGEPSVVPAARAVPFFKWPCLRRRPHGRRHGRGVTLSGSSAGRR